MKKLSGTHLSAGVVSLAAFALAAGPSIASAATNSAATTVTAAIQSSISVSTSSTVSMNISPLVGGAQSSASDTVTVSTNNASGYNLSLANSDSTSELSDGASHTIAAHSGTYAAPTALANNSWGYAVPALNNFDASYSSLTSAASSASKWAGVPVSGSGQQIKTNNAAANEQQTTVWYSAKADMTKPTGNYSDEVTYTATTNP